jgi:hypothetical protein
MVLLMIDFSLVQCVTVLQVFVFIRGEAPYLAISPTTDIHANGANKSNNNNTTTLLLARQNNP